MKFLRHKYFSYIKKESTFKFKDYYPYTNKKVKLGAEHTLFTIPFFDGLYVSSPCSLFINDLSGILNEYNKQETGDVFVLKDIEKN